MSNDVIKMFREDVAGKLRSIARQVTRMDGKGLTGEALIRVNDMVDDLQVQLDDQTLLAEEARSRRESNRKVFSPV